LTHVTANWKKRLFGTFAALAISYAAILGFFDYAMRQPPDEFAGIMKHVGPVPFLLFPFETMWKQARRGHLQIGDAAPDFTLPLLDHSGTVALRSFHGKQPVVLIFGSYT